MEESSRGGSAVPTTSEEPSLCIAKNQPECIYRQKPLRKVKTKRVWQQRMPTSGLATTKHPAERSVSSMADVLAARHPCGVVQPQYGTVVMSKFPLKRCRLSASPATGLVGMQENAFLDNYFSCLGLLPLANESIIRQAMVKLMISSVAPITQVQQHNVQQSALSPFGVRGEGGLKSPAVITTGDEAVRTPTFSPNFRSDDQGAPSMCIMWCAIGLGALVQGAPVEKVTRYVELARTSLAECFDGNTVDTARAYIAMAFLHTFLGEEDMNRKYMAFATNIVNRLPSEMAPETIHNMLLASVKSDILWGPKASLFGMDLRARLPPKAAQEEEIVDTSVFCNMLLENDFRFRKTLAEDLSVRGVAVGDESEEIQGTDGRGVAMKEFVRESLPKLLRVSSLATGSGATSGIGGLIYYGHISYMKIVDGDKFQAFVNIFQCAKIMLRYPGICRFRTHLTHCVLAASAVACRPIYDQMRDIYNAVRPTGFKPAPPGEEWTEMNDICDHIFCRSVEAEIKDFKFEWDGTDLPDPFPSSKWSSCTDASCGDADRERSPSPPPPTTNLYPDKASKSLKISVPTLATEIDLSPDYGPSGASPEATVGQTGMLTAVEAGMQPVEPAMTTDPLVTASTAPLRALPSLSATFPSPIKTSDARASGGNGMPVAEVVYNGINAVRTSAVATLTGVLQMDSTQPLCQYDIVRNEAEKGVAIDSRDCPAGAIGAVVDLHSNAPTSVSTPAPTWAESSSSSAPLTAFRDDVGMDDSGFDLDVTDDTLEEAVNILFSEGLFEEETMFQNVK